MKKVKTDKGDVISDCSCCYVHSSEGNGVDGVKHYCNFNYPRYELMTVQSQAMGIVLIPIRDDCPFTEVKNA